MAQQNLLWILFVAGLWAIGGVVFGFSLSMLLGIPVVAICASTSTIIGLILLLILTKNEFAQKTFYEDVRDDNDEAMTDLPLLIAILVTLITAGLMMWLSIWLTAQLLGD